MNQHLVIDPPSNIANLAENRSFSIHQTLCQFHALPIIWD